MRQRPPPSLTVVSGGSSAYSPTDEHRRLVVLSIFNGLSHDRIAAILGITRAELERHYRNELDDGADRALLVATDNMLWLAGQRFDLGVSLRANQALLGPRIRSWRAPAAEPATSTGSIDDMDLDTINRQIARLERDMAAAGARRLLASPLASQRALGLREAVSLGLDHSRSKALRAALRSPRQAWTDAIADPGQRACLRCRSVRALADWALAGGRRRHARAAALLLGSSVGPDELVLACGEDIVRRLRAHLRDLADADPIGIGPYRTLAASAHV